MARRSKSGELKRGLLSKRPPKMLPIDDENTRSLFDGSRVAKKSEFEALLSSLREWCDQILGDADLPLNPRQSMHPKITPSLERREVMLIFARREYFGEPPHLAAEIKEKLADLDRHREGGEDGKALVDMYEIGKFYAYFEANAKYLSEKEGRTDHALDWERIRNVARQLRSSQPSASKWEIATALAERFSCNPNTIYNKPGVIPPKT